MLDQWLSFFYSVFSFQVFFTALQPVQVIVQFSNWCFISDRFLRLYFTFCATMMQCSEWNKAVLTPVSHMISLQPLISICPSGDVSKRTKATLMDTLPWAPVHPFHPSMPLYFPNQNNEPFRNSTQGSQPTVVHGSPDFSPPSFAKASASPAASRRLKNHSSVGQVWPLFQQDKLAEGILFKSPWM